VRSAPSCGRPEAARRGGSRCPRSKACALVTAGRAERKWAAHKKQKPRREPGPQTFVLSCQSVAAVDQPPTRSPGGRDQLANIATAISVIARCANNDAGAAPAQTVVPSPMPAAFPGGGRGGRQSSRAQQCCGYGNKREFAKHGCLHKWGANGAVGESCWPA